MFLHGFDGPWLKNPFWKSKFLLREAADLRAAHNCGIAEFWIDPLRGDAPAAPAPDPAPPQTAMPAPAVTAPAPPARAERVAFDQEMRHAASMFREARGATVAMFNEARLGNAIDTDFCMPLVTEITQSIMRNPGALISLVRLKAGDDYTYMHSVAVCALMVALAQTLGLDDDACKEAGMAGLLHDIGKACLPLDILQKPGKLTDAEFDTVRRHPERGHALLLQGELTSAAVLDVCLHHHEKVDGSGYPHGLAGTDITLFARMGAVCDVYDAITSNRPYKTGWDPAESVARMLSWHGHFDEQVLTAFIKTVGIYPVGSLVALRSGRVAVVIEQNPDAFTKPVVKVFFSNKSAVHIAVERIDLARPGEQDIIVGREARERWDSRLIDGLWAGEWADGAV